MRFFRSEEPDQGELVQRQQRHAVHQTNLKQVQNGESGADKEYLRELTRNEIDEQTLDLMANLMSPDFMLSNLTGAEQTEIKYLARNVALRIKRMHPPQESGCIGEERKAVFGEGAYALRPLSSYEESLIDQAVLLFHTRPPRSRDGWQQDEVSKQLSVSKIEDGKDENQGGSLFPW